MKKQTHIADTELNNLKPNTTQHLETAKQQWNKQYNQNHTLTEFIEQLEKNKFDKPQQWIGWENIILHLITPSIAKWIQPQQIQPPTHLPEGE